MKHFGQEIYRDDAVWFSKYPFRRHVIVFSISDINWHSIVKKDFSFFSVPIKKYDCRPWILIFSVLYSPLLALLFWFSNWPMQAPSECFLCSFDMSPSFFVHFFTFWHSKVLRLTCTFLPEPWNHQFFLMSPGTFQWGMVFSLIAFLTYSLKYPKSTSNKICPKPWSIILVSHRSVSK